MNQTSTHFVHVDRAEHLDQFVQDKIVSTVAEFKLEGKYSLEIWISKERAETEHRGACFSCEATLKLADGGAPVSIKKSNDSFYVAVEEVSLALKNVLIRRSREKGRGAHRLYEKIANVAPAAET